MQDELQKYSSEGGLLQIPDTLFVMNAYDKPLCPVGSCSAPIFSYNKPWRPKDNEGVAAADPRQQSLPSTSRLLQQQQHRVAGRQGGRGGTQRQQQRLRRVAGMSDPGRASASMGRRGGGFIPGYMKLSIGKPNLIENPSLGRASSLDSDGTLVTASEPSAAVPAHMLEYDDILFPVLNHPFDSLVYFPWPNKSHVAMMRAGIYPAMDARWGKSTSGLPLPRFPVPCMYTRTLSLISKIKELLLIDPCKLSHSPQSRNQVLPS